MLLAVLARAELRRPGRLGWQMSNGSSTSSDDDHDGADSNSSMSTDWDESGFGADEGASDDFSGSSQRLLSTQSTQAIGQTPSDRLFKGTT